MNGRAAGGTGSASVPLGSHTGKASATRRGVTRRGVARRGVTLTELLVVMGILMILFAAATPKLRPAIEARRTREAARAINAYFGSARATAMSSGRDCGVKIDRLFTGAGGAR